MSNIITLRWKAEKEAYNYFDTHIRPLEKDADGNIDVFKNILEDNDADAFRHAYVSGIYTLEYGHLVANILGLIQEESPNFGGSASNSEDATNMDYWNNAVGRKYGKKAKTEGDLAALLQKALENGEMITSLKDRRKYKGKTRYIVSSKKRVLVLKESKTGQNLLFFDQISGDILERKDFAKKIKNGNYPDYTVVVMNSVETPVSKRDKTNVNNLG